jgi:hypothetical protein
MKPVISRSGSSVALVALATAALPASTAADSGRPGCIVPDVVGVSLSAARQALQSSGCSVIPHQLPPHGQFVTPPSPDARQLVASQSPRPGSHTGQVTISLKPLCAQPDAPGPDTVGPTTSRGPSELVSGVFLQGGPVRTAPGCRHGTPSAGTLTVTSAAGQIVAHRVVREGRFGVFPLKPGQYTLLATLPGGAPPVAPRPVTILAHKTTRLNLVAKLN